jgi:hypothetical protein
MFRKYYNEPIKRLQKRCVFDLYCYRKRITALTIHFPVVRIAPITNTCAFRNKSPLQTGQVGL